MEHNEDLKHKMREIYRAILQRIVDTGETEESDILFMHLYKTEFEQNTPKEIWLCTDKTLIHSTLTRATIIPTTGNATICNRNKWHNSRFSNSLCNP